MTHEVTCYVTQREVYSCVYDPNGNPLTYGALVDLVNELQDDCIALKGTLQNVADCRDEFEGPSLDYMQGYRDGQQHLQELANVGLSSVLS